MTATTIYRKRNDTAAPLRAQCLNGEQISSASAVNLSGASSAKVIIRHPDGTLLSATATIADQTLQTGWVSYSWGATDLDLVGEHRIEVEVTWANGSKETFPQYGYGKLIVSADNDDL